MIKTIDGKRRYFDRSGAEITEGCLIRYPDGKTKRVYLTEDYQLGVDATNPAWIKSGRAAPCEFGIYPIGIETTNEVEVVEEK